ncbi:hypothetical protein LV160_008808 [Aspergillus fumigatus]|nr:hypothetical protein LV160_008808 [Aspergillus fumigatus]
MAPIAPPVCRPPPPAVHGHDIARHGKGTTPSRIAPRPHPSHAAFARPHGRLNSSILLYKPDVLPPCATHFLFSISPSRPADRHALPPPSDAALSEHYLITAKRHHPLAPSR